MQTHRRGGGRLLVEGRSAGAGMTTVGYRWLYWLRAQRKKAKRKLRRPEGLNQSCLQMGCGHVHLRAGYRPENLH